MRYGLSDECLKRISGVFDTFPEVEQVVLYGSRAKGSYRPASDIDITLIGELLTTTILSRISWELDDLLLPYNFDISIYHHITDKHLRRHIENEGVTIYLKK